MDDLTDAINEAMNDAITDGDGRPRRDAIEHHLAARELRIVPVGLTVAELHDRCKALAKRLGSKAGVRANIDPIGTDSLSIYTDNQMLAGFRYVSARDGWDAALAEVEGWLEKRASEHALVAVYFDDPAFGAVA